MLPYNIIGTLETSNAHYYSGISTQAAGLFGLAARLNNILIIY